MTWFRLLDKCSENGRSRWAWPYQDGRKAVTIGGIAIIVVLDIEGALLTHNISILIIINAGTCITGHQMTQSILSSASHCPTPRNQKTSPGAVCGEPKSKLAFLRAHGIALRA